MYRTIKGRVRFRDCSTKFFLSSTASPVSLLQARQALGVSKCATEEEVKAAFRRRALQLHPDINPKPGAEYAFIELQKSFEVAIVAAKFKRPRSPSECNTSARTMSWNSAQQQARSKDTWDAFASNPDAFFAAQAQAMKHDDAMREKFRRESDEWRENRDARHEGLQHETVALRGGWFEEKWISVRKSHETGFKTVRQVRVRITEPTTEDYAEGEYEEWLGDDGAPRRRSLKRLPDRFDLARKMFGPAPFISMSEQRRAVQEFGSIPLAAKSLASIFNQ